MWKAAAQPPAAIGAIITAAAVMYIIQEPAVEDVLEGLVWMITQNLNLRNPAAPVPPAVSGVTTATAMMYIVQETALIRVVH